MLGYRKPASDARDLAGGDSSCPAVEPAPECKQAERSTCVPAGENAPTPSPAPSVKLGIGVQPPVAHCCVVSDDVPGAESIWFASWACSAAPGGGARTVCDDMSGLEVMCSRWVRVRVFVTTTVVVCFAEGVWVRDVQLWALGVEGEEKEEVIVVFWGSWRAAMRAVESERMVLEKYIVWHSGRIRQNHQVV